MQPRAAIEPRKRVKTSFLGVKGLDQDFFTSAVSCLPIVQVMGCYEHLHKS